MNTIIITLLHRIIKTMHWSRMVNASTSDRSISDT